MKQIRKILIVLLWLISGMLSAQILTPVHWVGSHEVDTMRLVASIDQGWHMSLVDVVVDDTMHQDVLDVEYTNNAKVKAVGKKIVVSYVACDDTRCMSPETFTYSTIQSNELVDTPNANRSLWLIFLFGLLGGFLAIFTPCVWPIIPMTVSFFMKKEQSSLSSNLAAIIYGFSIVIIYVGLGLLITIIFGASALNALSTNAVVNLFFFALMVVFAFSFFGLFELTLPSSWSTKIDSKARNTSGVISIMLMAFTLVIVSFSCTGPIVGTLLVEAASHSLLAPIIGMLGFAIALALPFSIFALFPTWMHNLPKSGSWMTTFKVTLAFIELALSLKFFSVADMAYGWHLLSRPLFIALWALIFLLLGIYLLGVFEKRWGGLVRMVLAVVSIAFAIYLIPGVWGAPVKAISAFAPPMQITDRDVFYDYDEGLQYAQQTGKPVLLDFTGYGCVNCRKMEAYVFTNDEVKKHLKNYVYITLYVDDKRDGIGETNSKIQREIYGANAQPYYIQLNSRGEIISSPYAFSIDAEDFMKWLQY